MTFTHILLMHLSILQVYYEPLDITGPALSSNGIVWCRLQRVNELILTGVLSRNSTMTLLKRGLIACDDPLVSILYMCFTLFFLVYIVILQCSTRLSLPSKLIRTGVVFNVWGRFGGCWKGVAHHLEHQVHEFLLLQLPVTWPEYIPER